MKKVIMLGAFVASAVFTSQAQSSTFSNGDNFEIGLRAGVNLSTIRGEGGGSEDNFWNSKDTRSTGFTAGVFTRLGNKVFIQPEFMVTQKGGTAEDILGIDRNFKQTYFDIPVLIGVRASNVIRINAGPVATFLVNEDDSFLENIGLQDDKDGFRRALLGYQLGVGFDISRIRLDMRYEGNVNDVFNIDYDDDQTRDQFAGKGNSFSLTAGFAF